MKGFIKREKIYLPNNKSNQKFKKALTLSQFAETKSLLDDPVDCSTREEVDDVRDCIDQEELFVSFANI